MRVLLYGTSANPPCGMGGHTGIVEFFSSQFDQVWVLPVYQHIYSSKRNLAPFEHRLNLLRLAFQSLSQPHKACVKETEKDVWDLALQDTSVDPSSIRIGSIDIVTHLQAQHPDVEFSLLLGADTYNDLIQGKWKGGLRLLDAVRIVVIAREGIALRSPTSDRVSYVHVPILDDSSSTQARSATSDDELRRLLFPQVLAYIQEHKLYQFAH
ncbi:hypothetical protein SDRG_03404 [Saprolegnia diclina VS20]|uniref:Cytidyltransferase-like domain-containing protein n=1 Tax=Saprolegnia diclina (strain VS20) TaxID=1156394 RepID=T0QM84_SAPDV|nr:hypothetical protein SDRG_03404 [Saprolegnia diclina VS20]EQC39199.1 hypothetical protein SDRG_03404 [Saprolegnia diclina VS20]|eukprot:XP_008607260.1 hypothetical protein SDRG_03404 [Saprolegnia diclina VS20]